MKERKNLYFLDDICIILSYLLFLFFAYRLYPLVRIVILEKSFDPLLLQNLPVQWLMVTAGVLVSALFLQLFGRVVRKRERYMLKIINTVALYKTISLSSLAYNTEIPEQKLEQLVRQIAGGGFLPIQLDGQTVKLITLGSAGQQEQWASPSADATVSPGKQPPRDRPPEQQDLKEILEKLRRGDSFTSIATSWQGSGTGSATGAGTGSAPSGKATIPSSPGGGTAFEQGTRSGTSGNAPVQGNSGQGGKPKKFNLLIFFLLFIIFWPLALLYVMRFALANSARNAMIGKLQELQQTQAGKDSL